jgi:hypothetical protein
MSAMSLAAQNNAICPLVITILKEAEKAVIYFGHCNTDPLKNKTYRKI